MTRNNDSHSSESTSSAKSKTGKNSHKLDTEVKRLTQQLESLREVSGIDLSSNKAFGWKLPGIEAYSVKYWSTMYQASENTICNWIRDRAIPYIGNEAKNSYIKIEVWSEYMSKDKPVKTDEQT